MGVDVISSAGQVAGYTDVTLHSGQVVGNVRQVPITGHVVKQRLKNGKTMILAPDPGGKLKPGDNGPLGGKISQIRCLGNQAMAIVGMSGINSPINGKTVTLSATTTEYDEIRLKQIQELVRTIRRRSP